nr:hypothetical protein HK105_005497 [Polyrhizophydium stewartii]
MASKALDGSGQPDVTLRSHWDRLPAELHHWIFAQAGLWTQLTAGRLLGAELRALCAADRMRLWRAALEDDADWAAATLPRMPGLTELAQLARSEAMCRRLAAAGVWDRLAVARAAVVGRWMGLVSECPPALVAQAAAAEGVVDILEDLVCWQDFRHMRLALGSGSVACVEWLYIHVWNLYLPPMALEWAACSIGKEMIDGTGNAEALAFIIQVAQPTVSSPLPLSYSSPSVDYHRTLLEAGIRRSPSLVIRCAIKNDSLPLAKWAKSTLRSRVRLQHLYKYSGYVTSDLARWVVAELVSGGECTGVLPRRMLRIAASRSWLGVLRDAIARDPKQKARIAAVAELASVRVLEWMHEKYPGCISQATLCAAAEAGNVASVAFILGNVRGDAWDMDAARSSAGCRRGIHTNRQSVLAQIDAFASLPAVLDAA